MGGKKRWQAYVSALLRIAAPELVIAEDHRVMDDARHIDFLLYSKEPHPIWGPLAKLVADRLVIVEISFKAPDLAKLERHHTKLSWMTTLWLEERNLDGSRGVRNARDRDRSTMRVPGGRPPLLLHICRHIARKALARLGFDLAHHRSRDTLILYLQKSEHRTEVYFSPGTSNDPGLSFLAALTADERSFRSRIRSLLGDSDIPTLITERVMEALMNERIPSPEEGHWITVEEVRAQGREQGRQEGLREGRQEGRQDGRKALLEVVRVLFPSHLGRLSALSSLDELSREVRLLSARLPTTDPDGS